MARKTRHLIHVPRTLVLSARICFHYHTAQQSRNFLVGSLIFHDEFSSANKNRFPWQSSATSSCFFVLDNRTTCHSEQILASPLPPMLRIDNLQSQRRTPNAPKDVGRPCPVFLTSIFGSAGDKAPALPFLPSPVETDYITTSGSTPPSVSIDTRLHHRIISPSLQQELLTDQSPLRTFSIHLPHSISVLFPSTSSTQPFTTTRLSLRLPYYIRFFFRSVDICSFVSISIHQPHVATSFQSLASASRPSSPSHTFLVPIYTSRSRFFAITSVSCTCVVFSLPTTLSSFPSRYSPVTFRPR